MSSPGSGVEQRLEEAPDLEEGLAAHHGGPLGEEERGQAGLRQRCRSVPGRASSRMCRSLAPSRCRARDRRPARGPPRRPAGDRRRRPCQRLNRSGQRVRIVVQHEQKLVARLLGAEVPPHDPDVPSGIMARNLAAREASSELLLMLDDDSYPLPGAIETLSGFDDDPGWGSRRARSRRRPRDRRGERARHDTSTTGSAGPERQRSGRRRAVVLLPGGGVHDQTRGVPRGRRLLRAVLPGGSRARPRTRLLAHGWDVRYFPSARFVHLKAESGRDKSAMLRTRVRNQLWYFYRHFPASVAARRIPAYLVFDLLESARSGALGRGAVGSATPRTARAVRGTREPLPRPSFAEPSSTAAAPLAPARAPRRAPRRVSCAPAAPDTPLRGAPARRATRG